MADRGDIVIELGGRVQTWPRPHSGLTLNVWFRWRDLLGALLRREPLKVTLRAGDGRG